MGASREVPDSAWGGQETPVGASHQEDILADNSGKGSEEGTGFQQGARERSRENTFDD